MNSKFKKVMIILGGTLMVGATIGAAAAVSAYPNPFVNNNVADVAIIHGSNAGPTDIVAATNIVNNLVGGIDQPNSGDDSSTLVDRVVSDGV